MGSKDKNPESTDISDTHRGCGKRSLRSRDKEYGRKGAGGSQPRRDTRN